MALLALRSRLVEAIFTITLNTGPLEKSDSLILMVLLVFFVLGAWRIKNGCEDQFVGEYNRWALDSLKSSFQSSSFSVYFPLTSLCHHSLLFFLFPSLVTAQGWTFLWGISRRCVGSVFGRVTVFFWRYASYILHPRNAWYTGALLFISERPLQNFAV